MSNNRIIKIIIIIVLLTNLISTFAMLALQLDSRNARASSSKERQTILCVLKIQPQDRTEAAFAACKK